MEAAPGGSRQRSAAARPRAHLTAGSPHRKNFMEALTLRARWSVFCQKISFAPDRRGLWPDRAARAEFKRKE